MLPTYENFEEKEKNFKLYYINSIDEFKTFLNDHKQSKGLYRGISSSQYKIYTSLQRHLIENDIQNFNITKYISNARNEKILKLYFETFNITPSKFSIWSYLQHYGAPTPIIDFTLNIENALYFAIEKFNSDSFNKKNSIEDRFSIFFIRDSDIELINVDKVYESFKNYNMYSSQVFNSYPTDENFGIEQLYQHKDIMLDINLLEIFLINYKKEFTAIYNSYNNIRIIAQEGIFINNSNLKLPLEENLKKFFIEATIFQHSPWDEIDTPESRKINEEYEQTLYKNRAFQSRLKENIIHSYEINKDLIPEIKNLLTVTKEDIYPNEEKIAWNIFEKTKQ